MLRIVLRVNFCCAPWTAYVITNVPDFTLNIGLGVDATDNRIGIGLCLHMSLNCDVVSFILGRSSFTIAAVRVG